MNEIVQLISGVGFPIVFCLLMWKKISDSDDKNREIMTEFKVAISEFKTSMQENNRLLQKVCDKLDVHKAERSDINE